MATQVQLGDTRPPVRKVAGKPEHKIYGQSGRPVAGREGTSALIDAITWARSSIKSQIMETLKFTNPVTNEKFIHREKNDGKVDFFYGPKDTLSEKKHGHIVFGQDRSVIFIRNPKGE